MKTTTSPRYGNTRTAGNPSGPTASKDTGSLWGHGGQMRVGKPGGRGNKDTSMSNKDACCDQGYRGKGSLSPGK